MSDESPRPRSWFRRLAGFIGQAVLVLFLYLVFFAVYSWTLGDWTTRRVNRPEAELHRHRSDLRRLTVVADRWPEFLTRMRELEDRARNLDPVLPATPDLDPLLSRLHRLARREGLSVAERTPQPDARELSELYAELRFGFEAEGSLAGIERFLRDVRMLAPGLKAEGVEVTRVGIGRFTLHAQLRALQFLRQAPDEEQRAEICARDDAAMFLLADAVVAAELLESHREEEGRIRRLRGRYRIRHAFKGAFESGRVVTVGYGCLDAPPPPGVEWGPMLVPYCPGGEGLALSGVDPSDGSPAAETAGTRRLFLRASVSPSGPVSIVSVLTDELALWSEVPRQSKYGCRTELPEDLLEGFRRMEEWRAGT